MIKTEKILRDAVAIIIASRHNGRKEIKLGATQFWPELPSPLSWVLGELHSNRDMVTLPSLSARIPKEYGYGTSIITKTALARKWENDISHLETLVALLTMEINSMLSARKLLTVF